MTKTEKQRMDKLEELVRVGIRLVECYRSLDGHGEQLKQEWLDRARNLGVEQTTRS